MAGADRGFSMLADSGMLINKIFQTVNFLIVDFPDVIGAKMALFHNFNLKRDIVGIDIVLGIFNRVGWFGFGRRRRWRFVSRTG